MSRLLPLSLFLILLFHWTAGAQSSPAGCACCGEAFRQFDFWLGDWETFTPDEKLAGNNRIVLLQDSCVLQENWVSARNNYTGTSYNFYDPQTEKWYQTWIDNKGGNLRLSGGMEGNSMVLYSEELIDQEGRHYTNRISWTPASDGSVRQLWEVSYRDSSSSWKTVFDGIYRRKK